MATATVSAPVKTDKRDAFYGRMGTLCLTVALIGFAPSYWTPMASGTLDLPLAIHAHGVLFFGWLILFRVQASLIGRGRTALHRRLGVAGAVLASAMVAIVLRMQAVLASRYEARGFHAAAAAFAWINVSDMILFAGLVIAAVANARRPEVHKRLMLAATFSLMAIPIGRILLTAGHMAGLIRPGAGGPPPIEAAYVPHALAMLLVVGAIWHDRQRSQSLHHAYTASLAAAMVQIGTLAWIGRSEGWARIADAAF